MRMNQTTLTTGGVTILPPATNKPSPLLAAFISMIDSLFAEIFAVDGSGGGPSSFGFSTFSTFSSAKNKRFQFVFVLLFMKSFTTEKRLSSFFVHIYLSSLCLKLNSNTLNAEERAFCFARKKLNSFFSLEFCRIGAHKKLVAWSFARSINIWSLFTFFLWFWSLGAFLFLIVFFVGITHDECNDTFSTFQ